MKRLLVLAIVLGGCGSEEAGGERVLTREQLMDPETCKDCHPAHYDEWSGSMHAYASEDPVFVAMNARGQRETNGALGDLCVRCHAPMAVAEGATTDGSNLAELPRSLQGVTCYFCHDAESVQGEHNAALALSGGVTMRGGVRDPVSSGAHRSAYSELFDRTRPESAAACGGCHDIVLPSPPAPAEVHLERTFAEWKSTIFSVHQPGQFLSCASCHMRAIPNSVIADAPGVPTRPARHLHTFAGVDLALTPFPNREAQRQEVEQMLDTSLRAEMCVSPATGIEVLLDNVAAGHRFPSGAAQDRRVWTEVVAYAAGVEVYASGKTLESGDPDLWVLRDGAFDASGGDAHMFWDVASTDNDCTNEIVGCTIPGPVTTDPTHPDFFITHVLRRFPKDASLGIPGGVDRVTLRVFMRPMGLEGLDDLIASGDLDPSVKDAMPTLELLPNRHQSDVALEWTPEAAQHAQLGFTKTINGLSVPCVTNGARKQ